MKRYRLYDDGRREFLAKRTAEMLQKHPEFSPLVDKLLAINGDFVVLRDVEPDLPKILERGRIWDTRGLKVVSGAESNCHGNSAELWRREAKLQIVTGYGMSKDGVWRQHSWVADTESTKQRVFETTERRVVYFGFAMDASEAGRFYQANCSPEQSASER